MAADYSICLGTVGWGVWHSPDAGNTWTRHRAPFPLNSRIQALVAHPKEAQTVFAGGVGENDKSATTVETWAWRALFATSK